MSLEAQRRATAQPQPSIHLAEVLARYGIVLVLVIMVAALSVLSPLIRGEQYFLTSRNLLQVALQAAINAIIAVGMTFIITSGGIDLSVGSIVGLSGVVAAYVMKSAVAAGTMTGLSIALLGFVVGVGMGVLCGLFNSLLITRVGLPPFIATLGTMGIFRGFALVISDGRPIYGFGREFQQLFAGTLNLGAGEQPTISIPSQVIAAALVALVCWFILTQTRLGKYAVAIGGNEETARLAGISVNSYKMKIYALGGLLTGLAAVLTTARLSSAEPTAGISFELDAIAAAVMGGTSLTGGEGSITGTIVGALVISLVRNGLNLFNVQSYWQEVVIGSVIVLAVMLDQWRKRQARLRR